MAKSRSELVDLFLCHNRADKDWVRTLAEHIESETFDGTPHGRPLRVFFDEWDIDVGQNVLVKINHGLSVSRYVAVIISPEFLEAAWPTLEWTHVVADDPINRKGRLIPLFYRDYSEALQKRAELPAPLKTFNWLDFRKPGNFKRNYQRLIRNGSGPASRPRQTAAPFGVLGPFRNAPPLPRARHLSGEQTLVPDVVLGNLLPVESYPSTVWKRPTDARKNEDVWSKVTNPPAFILREKHLYTFVDLTLTDPVLRSVVKPRDIQSHAVGRWKGDAVKWRWFIDLLNRCIGNAFGGLPITRATKGRFFFRPREDGTDRDWQNGTDPSRKVAAKKTTQTGPDSFRVHQGAELYVPGFRRRPFSFASTLATSLPLTVSNCSRGNPSVPCR